MMKNYDNTLYRFLEDQFHEIVDFWSYEHNFIDPLWYLGSKSV